METSLHRNMAFCLCLILLLMITGCAVSNTNEQSISLQDENTDISDTIEASEAIDIPGSIDITDMLERTVTVPSDPQSVAVLLGSFADVWLLSGGSIRATVDESWSSLDLDLPKDTVDLGDFQNFSAELLFDSDPDLIIASSNTQIDLDWMDTFDEMGIPALYFDVEDFNDYLEMLKICTSITGRDDLYQKYGLDVEQEVDAALKESHDNIERNGSAPTVLCLRASASGIKAKGSEGTVLGEMVADLGCTNIADGGILLDDLSMEEIIIQDPDFILIVYQGQDVEGTEKRLENELFENPAWSDLSAVKNGHLYYMDKTLYNLKPNSRWGEAYEHLVEILYN